MSRIIDNAREKTTVSFRALDEEMPVHGREYVNVQMSAGPTQMPCNDLSGPSAPPPQQ